MWSYPSYTNEAQIKKVLAVVTLARPQGLVTSLTRESLPILVINVHIKTNATDLLPCSLSSPYKSLNQPNKKVKSLLSIYGN